MLLETKAWLLFLVCSGTLLVAWGRSQSGPRRVRDVRKGAQAVYSCYTDGKLKPTYWGCLQKATQLKVMNLKLHNTDFRGDHGRNKYSCQVNAPVALWMITVKSRDALKVERSKMLWDRKIRTCCSGVIPTNLSGALSSSDFLKSPWVYRLPGHSPELILKPISPIYLSI